MFDMDTATDFERGISTRVKWTVGNAFRDFFSNDRNAGRPGVRQSLATDSSGRLALTCCASYRGRCLMRAKFGFVVVGLTLLGTVAAVGAHHGFSSEYDQNKPVTLTGVVTKIEWTNPHSRFYIDVKDEKGTVTNWNFELASANSLRRNGWTKDTLKVGDVITAKGFAALSGVKMANANSVTLADGTALFAATDAPSVQQTPQK